MFCSWKVGARGVFLYERSRTDIYPCLPLFEADEAAGNAANHGFRSPKLNLIKMQNKNPLLSINIQYYAITLIVITTAILTGCQSAPRASATTPAPISSQPVSPQVNLPSPSPNASAATPLAPRPRLVLALGGGAARGFAHIGVLQVLEENGLLPAGVVGTSAGSLVAALYAAGNSGAQLQRLARDMDESALTDWTFPLRGVIRGEALASFVTSKPQAS